MTVEIESILIKLSRIQQEDDELRPIIEILKKGDNYDNYYLKSHIMYKEVKGCELVVVPKSMEYEIIKQAHNKDHFSVSKTKKLLENDYYLPELEEKIRRCINRGKEEGELHPIPKKEIPLQTYHMDHLGPLESTSKMYNHIFMVIDAFTKFCCLYPTRSTTSREVIAKLDLQSTTFGNPEVMISDRGTAFTAAEFKLYCENERIAHHVITTGLPRANGQVERLNSVIIGLLFKINCQEPAKWYRHVPRVQQVINSTHHRSNNATPFE